MKISNFEIFIFRKNRTFDITTNFKSVYIIFYTIFKIFVGTQPPLVGCLLHLLILKETVILDRYMVRGKDI